MGKEGLFRGLKMAQDKLALGSGPAAFQLLFITEITISQSALADTASVKEFSFTCIRELARQADNPRRMELEHLLGKLQKLYES